MNKKERPILKNLIKEGTSELEYFQNITIRPIIKMQHDLLILSLRTYLKKRKIENNKIKLFMTKNPFIVEENILASEILFQMNKKKITNICVFKKGNSKKTTGVIHIHNLLNNLK